MVAEAVTGGWETVWEAISGRHVRVGGWLGTFYGFCCPLPSTFRSGLQGEMVTPPPLPLGVLPTASAGPNEPRTNQHNPQYGNHWAPRTWKRQRKGHRPQRPSERTDPTPHAKGRTGD